MDECICRYDIRDMNNVIKGKEDASLKTDQERLNEIAEENKEKLENPKISEIRIVIQQGVSIYTVGSTKNGKKILEIKDVSSESSNEYLVYAKDHRIIARIENCPVEVIYD
jgi:hypothetical protein